MTITSFLTEVGYIVTAAIAWVGEIWDFITAEPVMFTLILGVPLVGLGFGFIRRLFKVG